MRYETATLEDLKVILLDSIIRYKNSPVTIHAINESAKGFMLTIRSLYDMQDSIKVSLNSRFLNFLPVKLGYCNTPFGAVLIQRKPARAYKQGLHGNNIFISGRDGERNYLHADGIYNKYVADCIEGIYPSFEEAVDLVREYKVSVAYARTVCITANGELIYRGSRIGSVNSSDKSICLQWGKESFLRVLK